MDNGTILGFALMTAVMAGIAGLLIAFARPLARLQVRIMEVQLASIRKRGPIYLRIMAIIFILVGGMLALAAWSMPGELSLAVSALFVALLGLAMLIFTAPFARLQVRLLEWQIGWMSTERGAGFIRTLGIFLFVAFLGGLVFGYALGGPR
jgi:hypothetical protein